MAVPDQTQFVSPFPLENCKTRLEHRNEEKTLFAWRYQQRVRVDVWTLDHDRVGFRIKDSPKSSLEFDLGVGGIQLKGVLERRPDGQTDVLAYVDIGYLTYFFTGAFVLVLWGLSFIWLSTIFATVHPAILILGTGGLMVALAYFMLWWFDAQKVRLIGILEIALKGY